MEIQSGLMKLAKAMAEGSFDLHLHSYYSDGSNSPAELFQLAIGHKLKSIALTDHDTIDGMQSLLDVYQKIGMIGLDVPYVIPGVEISTRYVDANGQDDWTEVHLIAYFPDGGHEVMQDFLDDQRAARERRNEQICDRLQTLGYKISFADLQKRFASGVLGRPHIARLLVEKEYFLDVPAAFDELLSKDKPGYVPRELPETEAVIQLILDYQGIPVLSHPYLYDWTEKDELQEHLVRLQAAGLIGVELIHGETPLAYSALLSEISRDLNLLPTGGSDYHGTSKPGVMIFHEETNYTVHEAALHAWLKHLEDQETA